MTSPRTPRRAGRWALLLLTALTAAALSCSGPGEDRAAPAGGSHKRMLEWLAQVAEESRQDNPYLGLNPTENLRTDLAGLPEGPDLRRWLYNKLLGQHLLRLGRNDEAIEHYLEAYHQLEVFGAEIPDVQAATTVFELAVAYMRLGETQNCAMHHTSESCILPIRGGGVHRRPEPSQQAVRYLREVLERAPRGTHLNVRAHWLLNIASMTLGEYPDRVPATYRIDPAVFESDEDFPRFKEIADGLGLASFDLSGGAVVDDFDDDGWLDIVVSTSDTSGQMRHWRNLGDGRFEERTRPSGLEGLIGGLNLVQADYDNDGRVDLFVLRGGWWRDKGRHPNSLLRNEPDGTFRDVTLEAGLGQPAYPTQTAAWGDYDLDGDLDLYVGNEFDSAVAAPCQLFRNNGDGTFTDVAEAAGVDNRRYTKAVVWGDYDGDRYPDLYVSNLAHENRLYHNNGDGTFTDVALDASTARPISSFPAWFWDFDNDGALDLLVTGYGGVGVPPDVASVAASYLGYPTEAEPPALYRGDGRGGFTDVAEEVGLTRISLPMGANFGDLDNDGWLDFYLGTGYPFYEALMPNVMYRNRAGLDFTDVTTAGGFGHLQKGHGVAFADLDHDGDQDVFEQVGGAYPGDAFGNALFENPGFGRHWIKVRLRGVRSNRSAIGARIRVDVEGSGVRRSIFRTVGSGGSFGANPLRQEIGVGTSDRIVELEIYWPATDTRQVFRDLPVDRHYEVTEDEDQIEPHIPESFSFSRSDDD